MRISPALLLLLIVIIVFAPSIQDWAIQGGTAWYRPYVLWLVIIVFLWWTIYRGQKRRRKALLGEERESE